MPELAARLRSGALACLPVLIVALAWEAATRFALVTAALVPAPSQVAHAFVDLLREGGLLMHAGRSLWRAAAGLALAIAAGTALGVAMARLQPAERFFQPLVSVTYPIPKSALIPLLMLWLGIGDLSKIAVVFLGTLLPVVMGAYNGVRGIDRALLWSARNCGTSGLRMVARVLVPAALPEILAGIRVALALAFVLLVSSEMLVARDGLGHLIMLLGEAGQYAGMFAVALAVSGLGFLADRLFLQGMNSMLRWRTH